jgi:phosphoglycolate phosphatase
MQRVVFFDIDGTLVLTGGAGSRAMGLAFDDLFSIGDAFTGLAMAGRTDRFLLAAAAERAGVSADDPRLLQFRERYLRYLAEELNRPIGVARVLPGVRELLENLSTRRDVLVGLLTGNYAEAARLKLMHFDLWRYFACGAYGDDAVDRNHLVPVALDRAREHGVSRLEARHVFVVGDTPHDVACAAAAGARSIAVATGFSDRDSLTSSGADLVLDDLSDTRAVLAALEI